MITQPTNSQNAVAKHVTAPKVVLRSAWLRHTSERVSTSRALRHQSGSGWSDTAINASANNPRTIPMLRG